MHPKSYSIASGPSSATKSKASGGVWKKVKQLDWLAPEVGLNYRGHSGVKTYLGVVITLASSALFVSGLAYISTNYFDLSKPLVLQDVYNNPTYHDVNLSKHHRFSALVLIFNNTPMPASRISTFVTMESMVRKQELVESPSGVQFKSTALKKPLIPCKDLSPDVLKLMPKGTEFEWVYLSRFGMCPDFNLEDYKVFGKLSDKQVSYLELTVFPCSLGPGQCATKEMLDLVTVSHVRIEPNQNMSDYNNPIGYEWSTNDLFYLNIANR